MLLGTAYLQALMQLTQADSKRTTIGIDLRRASISPEPPTAIREICVLRMLVHMGLGESAERQIYRWRRDHRPDEVLTLPVGGKRFAEIPLEAMDGALDPFLDQLQNASWESLGGRRLDGLKDFAFTGTMNESARALTSRALRGDDLKTDNRIRLATAVYAEGEDLTAVEKIWAAVDGVSLLKSKRAAVETSHGKSQTTRRGDLRDAWVWREILVSRPRSLRAQSARFHP
jgi:hypothetical protein